ncbi:DUF2786 domain-containing protein [Pararoseomonas sp. SCSIO 73927]|uniref:DUF2786 domain-containing protein n=1 Tax=Pararoseomonas sp. SCSIO 73927 TaxID=3114537 RepID=UPI0030D242AE
MTDLDAVIRRIRALLQLTEANGCTEGEAVAAAAKALELMRQHGLDEKSVHTGRAERTLPADGRDTLRGLWAAVAYVTRCRLYYDFGRSPQVVYIGRAPWPEVADWLHGVVDAVSRKAHGAFYASPAYQRHRTVRAQSLARAAFQQAFVEGLRAKIIALVDEADNDFARDRRFAERALRAVPDLRPAGKAGQVPGFAGARRAGQSAARAAHVGWGIQGAGPRLIGGGRG